LRGEKSPPFDKGGEGDLGRRKGDLNLPQPLFTKEGRNPSQSPFYKGRSLKSPRFEKVLLLFPPFIKGARGI